MKLKDYVLKYGYLLRLTLIVGACLNIPVLALNFSVVRSSYKKMETNNQINYLDNTQYFAGYFEENMTMLANHALKMSLDRKLYREYVESSVWNTIEAATITLKDYTAAVPMVETIGIFFKGSDYILTTNYKYSLGRFIHYHSGDNEQVAENMKGFLTGDHKKRTVLFSTYDAFDKENAKLFVGVPVSMSDIDDTLIFYILNFDALQTSLMRTLGYESYGLSVFKSKDTLLYTNGKVDAEIYRSQELTDFLLDDENYLMEYADSHTTYTLFKYYDPRQDRTFLSFVPQAEV